MQSVGTMGRLGRYAVLTRQTPDVNGYSIRQVAPNTAEVTLPPGVSARFFALNWKLTHATALTWVDCQVLDGGKWVTWAGTYMRADTGLSIPHNFRGLFSPDYDFSKKFDKMRITWSSDHLVCPKHRSSCRSGPVTSIWDWASEILIDHTNA